MRKYSMISYNYRKHPRWMNAYCHYVNKIIKDDDFWRGCFYITQSHFYMNWFESGGADTTRTNGLDIERR